jgi:hypothetical protein
MCETAATICIINNNVRKENKQREKNPQENAEKMFLSV